MWRYGLKVPDMYACPYQLYRFKSSPAKETFLICQTGSAEMESWFLKSTQLVLMWNIEY